MIHSTLPKSNLANHSPLPKPEAVHGYRLSDFSIECRSIIYSKRSWSQAGLSKAQITANIFLMCKISYLIRLIKKGDKIEQLSKA